MIDIRALTREAIAENRKQIKEFIMHAITTIGMVIGFTIILLWFAMVIMSIGYIRQKVFNPSMDQQQVTQIEQTNNIVSQ